MNLAKLLIMMLFLTLPAIAMDKQQSIDLAIEKLTNKYKTKKSSIIVEEVEAVTWNNGSLGCPQPGMMYTQALVPGYRIQIKINNQTHWVHTGNNQAIICNDSKTAPGHSKSNDII